MRGLYLLHLNFPSITPAQLESGLLSNSLRRHTPLDFQATKSLVSNQKLFLANEGKQFTNYTRIKGIFETLLPKLIFTLGDDKAFATIKIRFSIGPSLLILLYLLSLLFLIYNALVFGEYPNLLTSILLPTLIFILVTKIELFLLKKTVLKALSNKGDS